MFNTSKTKNEMLLLLIDADAHRIESNRIRMKSLYKRPKSGVPCRVEQRSSGDVYTGHGNSKQWYDTSYLKKRTIKTKRNKEKRNEKKKKIRTIFDAFETQLL